MTNPRRQPILEAVRRFYEKAAPAGRSGCTKSRTGKHHFTGCTRRTCRYCGKEKA